jgi:hypothetical protein
MGQNGKFISSSFQRVVKILIAIIISEFSLIIIVFKKLTSKFKPNNIGKLSLKQ